MNPSSFENDTIEFSIASGKLQTVITLLHNGLKKYIAKISKRKKSDKKKQLEVDFSQTVRIIIDNWDTLYSKHAHADLKKLCKRSIQIRNGISHQKMPVIQFERDLETLIKLAGHLDNDLKIQIENIVNEKQNGSDSVVLSGQWLDLKEKGNEFFKAGNFTEAFILYTKAIKLDNKQVTLYLNRALCELKLDRLENARQDAEDALDLDSNNLKAYRILSEVLMKLDLFKEALEICTLGLQKDAYEETLLLRKRDLISKLVQIQTDLNPRINNLDDLSKNEFENMLIQFSNKLNKLNPKPCDVQIINMNQLTKIIKMNRLVGEAFAYMKGSKGKSINKKKAVELFEEAMENGNAEAMYNLGVFYGNGDIGMIDYSRMLRYYNMAASQKPFYKMNEKFLENLGVAQAENGIGNSYRDGRGVDIDYKQAFAHYLKSAEWGCPEGQNNVGSLLDSGKGVQANYTYAREWFRKAAEQGIAEAQLNYADSLLNGKGGPVNEKEAIDFYKKAADQGCPTALDKLQSNAYGDKSFNQMLSSTIKDSENKKDLNAFFLKAKNYHEGSYGFEKNLDLAYKYYKQAADDGHIESIVGLSRLLNELKRNKEAFSYFLIAAEKGVIEAQVRLVDLYALGHGCERDEEKARRWHLRAKKLREIESKEPEMVNDIEKTVEIGIEICNYEKMNHFTSEGFSISERITRFSSKFIENPKIKKILKHFDEIWTAKPSPTVESRLISMIEWFPDLKLRADKGSLTAQNFIISLQMRFEAKDLISRKEYERAMRLLRESFKYNDVLEINEKIYEAADLICEKNVDAKFIKARQVLKDIKGNISFVKKCIKQHPNEADFHHLLACLYGFDEEFQLTLNEIERALELEYRSDWLYDKATAFRMTWKKNSEIGKVIKAYQLFLDSNPLDHRKVPEAYYSIALMYLVNQEIELARTYWQKANQASKDRLPCFDPNKDFPPKKSLDLCFQVISNDPNICSQCGKKKPKFKCLCKSAFYCDSNCQNLNWRFHKSECKMKKP